MLIDMNFRSKVADFLLAGGQSQSWLLGNKIVTVTTSGGYKVGKAGLCEKCLTLARAASVDKVRNKATIQKLLDL